MSTISIETLKSAESVVETVARPAEISVLVLARNEAANLETLLPDIAAMLDGAGRSFEMIVVDASSADGTASVAERRGARAVQQTVSGYANALRQGLAECRGELVLSLDGDHSHRPEFVTALLDAARDADIVIASRYVPGGVATMPTSRLVLSHVLNRVFGVTLGLPYRDLSSGFRIYRTSAVRALPTRGEHFDVLPELAALAHFSGRRIREVPFRYHPREAGVSKARVLAFTPSYVRTLVRCLRAKRRAARR